MTYEPHRFAMKPERTENCLIHTHKDIDVTKNYQITLSLPLTINDEHREREHE